MKQPFASGDQLKNYNLDTVSSAKYVLIDVQIIGTVPIVAGVEQ